MKSSSPTPPWHKSATVSRRSVSRRSFAELRSRNPAPSSDSLELDNGRGEDAWSENWRPGENVAEWRRQQLRSVSPSEMREEAVPEGSTVVSTVLRSASQCRDEAKYLRLSRYQEHLAKQTDKTAQELGYLHRTLSEKRWSKHVPGVPSQPGPPPPVRLLVAKAPKAKDTFDRENFLQRQRQVKMLKDQQSMPAKAVCVATKEAVCKATTKAASRSATIGHPVRRGRGPSLPPTAEPSPARENPRICRNRFGEGCGLRTYFRKGVCRNPYCRKFKPYA